MARSTRLINNIYTLWGRKRFLLRVTGIKRPFVRRTNRKERGNNNNISKMDGDELVQSLIDSDSVKGAVRILSLLIKNFIA